MATKRETRRVLLRAAKERNKAGPRNGWKDADTSIPFPSNPNQMNTSHSPILAVEYSPSQRWSNAKTNPPKQNTAIDINQAKSLSMARKERMSTLLEMVPKANLSAKRR